MIRRRAKPNHRRDFEEPATAGSRRGAFRILALFIVLLSGCAGYWVGIQGPALDAMKLIVWADQFFPIESVEVNELQKVSQEEVLELLNLAGGRGLLSTDTGKVKQSLEAHPWIQQADVRRVFPDTLVVELKEREPAAVLRAGRHELLLGQDGAVIAEAGPGSFEGFPILTGIDYDEMVPRNTETTERVLSGIALASLLNEVGANRTEIDLHTPGDMVAYYDGLRIRFGEGAFENKLERYRRLAEGGLKRPGAMEGPGKREKGQDLSGVSKPGDVEVDLRFQDRIIVREKGGKRGWGEKTKSS
jgi:cell division septal protein FtsQ